MDALIAHSEHGAAELRALVGDPTRVHRIPHGAFDHLTHQSDERPLPDELAAVEGPVILCFGLIRPYKGVDVLLEAFRGARRGRAVDRRHAADGPDPAAPRWPSGAAGTVRFVDRFITDPEIPAYFRRADVVALPYRQIEQSGVLYTALAFGKPIVASAIGGFTEVGERDRALRLVAARRPRRARGRRSPSCSPTPRRGPSSPRQPARAAAGPYSWDARSPRRTLDLYRRLERPD